MKIVGANRMEISKKEKREKIFIFSRYSTQSRGRTGTGVNLLVFETSASTDSAIWAKKFYSSGRRTRTSDLRVMSPTSCQLLYPAMYLYVG